MNIKTVPLSQMKGNRIIKKMDGSTLELMVNGVQIIKGGNVVNQEAFETYNNKINDEQEANKAMMYAAQEAKPQEAPVDRVEKLEGKVEAIDTKIDAIMSLLQK